jgi:predicted ATP-dependent serine protease
MLAIKSLDAIEVPEWMSEYMSSGISVLDNFINGDGIIPSQMIALSASRGSGKTTLMLQYLTGLSKTNVTKKYLYVSREEPDIQLKKTATRVNATGFDIVGDDGECNISDIITAMDSYNLIVLDSFSCISGIGEEKAIKQLKDAAKQKRCSLICILHQTKAGDSSGSTHIGHLVDTVIDIERGDEETFGDDKTRILKMDKNRFGACGQIILRLERTGWDFMNPVDAKAMNEENKSSSNSPQAKKPKELKDIMDLIKSKGRVSFSDLSGLIPVDDSAAVGRFSRHLKELEKYGKVIAIGRGDSKVWEYVS